MTILYPEDIRFRQYFETTLGAAGSENKKDCTCIKMGTHLLAKGEEENAGRKEKKRIAILIQKLIPIEKKTKEQKALTRLFY